MHSRSAAVTRMHLLVDVEAAYYSLRTTAGLAYVARIEWPHIVGMDWRTYKKARTGIPAAAVRWDISARRRLVRKAETTEKVLHIRRNACLNL